MRAPEYGYISMLQSPPEQNPEQAKWPSLGNDLVCMYSIIVHTDTRGVLPMMIARLLEDCAPYAPIQDVVEQLIQISSAFTSLKDF